ncbi:acyl-CoA dehydrogenase family protein [Mycolicibacterium llatzerense]|uniref:acyl-CoA dehydrogenase family protein n=1 Tax=Mycolicibacterium llatzerense TaxID=280871 RepID=UPI0022A97329|nr:acyl-CoA dehydrogenase family protein [Mycolicibacterium llatzerense]
MRPGILISAVTMRDGPRALDRCVQLHGGYGYMREYLIARMYEDARVQRIYAGANEVMKSIIARSL